MFAYTLLGDVMNEVYIVKRGDTLYGISNQYGVSVTELAEINGVNASTLQIGQELIIPGRSGTNPDNMFMYTVKKGDTLYNIARVYGVSVDAIRNLNYLKNNQLVVGQVIRIPEIYTKPEEMVVPQYINYKVQKGDSLYSIARKYNLSVDTIMQDNGLKNTNLVLGENLKIRVKMEGIVEECFGEEYSPNSSTEYIVQKGDTLYGVAKKYNISVSDLLQANNITGTSLSIGQVLKIPSGDVKNYYTVLKGDSLYSIAKKFNTSVDMIKKKNNLVSNILTIGQVLEI